MTDEQDQALEMILQAAEILGWTVSFDQGEVVKWVLLGEVTAVDTMLSLAGDKNLDPSKNN